MKVSLDQNDRQFLEQLNRQGASTVPEICDSLGVTATAVRQRLVRLRSAGFIERELVRNGRGRPHHAYRVSDIGQRELGDNYSELAAILWQELQTIEEPAVRAHLQQRIQEALVKRYGRDVDGETVQERIAQLKTSLQERGFDVEVDETGPLPILRERNCPYLELAQSDPRICEMEQLVYEKILGSSVSLTSCCLDGHHCCEFVTADQGAVTVPLAKSSGSTTGD
ncbi:MAG: MarR family transcriptional regulator [Planctomycetaceae bacterium]|nr:MarR family transcriptional regulator [Planctomycetaceae bacterium]